MGHCDCFDDAGLFSEGLTYIYINMYNYSGRIYKLVE